MSAPCHEVQSTTCTFPAGQTTINAFNSFFNWNDLSGNWVIIAGSCEQYQEQLHFLNKIWKMLAFLDWDWTFSLVPRRSGDHCTSWSQWRVLSTLHHSLCISQDWMIYSQKKFGYPFLKCKGMNAAGFKVNQLVWSNQRFDSVRVRVFRWC